MWAADGWSTWPNFVGPCRLGLTLRANQPFFIVDAVFRRSFALLVTLYIAALAGCQTKSPEEQAMDALRKAGGRFVMEGEGEHAVPVGLSFSMYNQADDKTMALLAVAPTLKFFTIESAGITDAGLAELRNLPDLEALVLRNLTFVTDRGLAVLKDLPKLKTIRLYTMQHWSDRALERLRSAPGLEVVDIQLVPITDTSLGHLGSIPHLKDLTLKFTKIGEDALVGFHGSYPDVMLHQ